MDCSRLDAIKLKSLLEFMPTKEEGRGLAAYLESLSFLCDEAIASMTLCKQ